jgi:hypothetical protein
MSVSEGKREPRFNASHAPMIVTDETRKMTHSAAVPIRSVSQSPSDPVNLNR